MKRIGSLAGGICLLLLLGSAVAQERPQAGETTATETSQPDPQGYDPAGMPTTPEGSASDPATSVTGAPTGTATSPPASPTGAPVSTDSASLPASRSGTKLMRPSGLLSAPPTSVVKPAVDDKASAVIYSELLLVSDDLQQAEQQRRMLAPMGLAIKSRRVLKGLGMVISKYRVPKAQQNTELLKQLTPMLAGTEFEFNQRYLLQGDRGNQGREFSRQMSGFTDATSGEGIKLAMLDAAVQVDAAVFENARLYYSDSTGKDVPPTQHGTSVASLLVGQGVPLLGALPQAELHAINIFAENADGHQETRSDWWLNGLNELALITPRPMAVNMSFGGPFSRVLARAIKKLSGDMAFVAAAGNSGANSPVMFPASMQEVIAVTAVDMRKRVYRQAPQHHAISIAAPGVDIWAAGLDGGYYATGTSFASPWVTAALALLKYQGQGSGQLFAAAEDLGVPGPDPVFGQGLLRLPAP